MIDSCAVQCLMLYSAFFLLEREGEKDRLCRYLDVFALKGTKRGLERSE